MSGLYYFLTVALFNFLCLNANTDLAVVSKKVAYPTKYVYPIDDESVVSLPLVKLKGKILRHTFPGVPNYESIEEGDAPEIRWVLVISEAEIQRLQKANFIPDRDIYGPQQRGWVQLIPPNTEQDPLPFLDKQVVVEGYLGTLVFHVHTPITIEARNICNDK